MYPGIYNRSVHHSSMRRKQHTVGDAFRCLNCEALVTTQAIISGVLNRNHCPYCLHSRHVDHAHAGDRMSACKAVMRPIGLTVKPARNKYGWETTGELMLVHRCNDCGKLSLNRIAADDQVENLIEVFYGSTELDALTRYQIRASEIHILQMSELEMVLGQLHGRTQG